MSDTTPQNSEKTAQQLVTECQLIELNCEAFQAKRHWAAGRQHDAWRRRGYLTLIILNTLIASSLLTLLNATPWLTPYSPWVAAILSLIAAIISAYMAHFKPEESLRGHTNAATDFMALATRVRHLRLQLQSTDYDPSAAWQKLEALNHDYYVLVKTNAIHAVGSKLTQQHLTPVDTERQKLLAQHSNN